MDSKPKVYVETSVISYLAASPSRDPITAGRQASTRGWWDKQRSKYTLLVSATVESECRRGDPVQIERRIGILQDVSLFPVNQTILELAGLLVTPGAIPPKASTDAVHIAAAAVVGCEYLLTWNFRHLANGRIRREVERILGTYGYRTTICTPDELS